MRTCAALVLTILMFALAGPCVARQVPPDKRVYCTPGCSPPAAGTAYQYTDSHVRINNVVSFRFGNVPIQFCPQCVATCVSFINEGPEIISSVMFMFFPPDPLSPHPTLVVRGPIPVGILQYKEMVVVLGDADNMIRFGALCANTAANSVWVKEVKYTDGSSWAAPADAPNGAIAEMTNAQVPDPLASVKPSPAGAPPGSSQL